MTADVDILEDEMVESVERTINHLAVQRRELTDELARATDFKSRTRLADEIEALGKQSRKLEAERRRLNVLANSRPTNVSILKDGESMSPPTFELYERVYGNSVHGEPEPAVSLTTTAITLNALAMQAIGVKPGDTLSLLMARDTGMIALKKPPKGWSSNKSSKIAAVKASGAGVLNSLATFLRWAGVKPKQAKGIYHLTWDEDLEHWWFKIPTGSWTKPTAGTPADGVRNGSATRGTGVTSAAKRGDLPTTSPHRSGGR